MPTLIEWALHLQAKIEAQTRYAAAYESRYRNERVLPFIAAEYREVYGDAVDQLVPQLAPPRTGTAAIGVDALTERLTVAGAFIIRSSARWFMGNSTTSRMFGSPASSMTMRSIPGADPPCGGAPNLNALIMPEKFASTSSRE